MAADQQIDRYYVKEHPSGGLTRNGSVTIFESYKQPLRLTQYYTLLKAFTKLDWMSWQHLGYDFNHAQGRR
jgi:hypothetical protein